MHDDEKARIESFAARILRAIGQLLKEAGSLEERGAREGEGGEARWDAREEKIKNE